jgi:regulator of replication initiation timing
MATIRRLKATFAPDGTPGPNAVHWAVEVAPQGNVTKWVDSEAQAADFPAEVARKVADYYEGRANAGELAFGGKVGGAGGADVDEAAIAHAEQLGQENETLRLENARLDALVKRATDSLSKAAESVNAHAEDKAALHAENQKLRATLAATEKELAAAQELLNAKE